PMQHGIADMLNKYPDHPTELPQFYQQKRDAFTSAMKNTRFKLLPCSGTYFQLADYSEISDLNEYDFCHWLTETAGVAAIPISSFYQTPIEGQRIVRFCFAKSTETLEQVGHLLSAV
ncbi:MAG: aminotransferase, partial [Gammaproteobacteria bacterium]